MAIYVGVVLVDRPDDRHLIDHFQIETAVDEGVGLLRIVGQQADFRQPEILEDLDADAVIAAVDLMAQGHVGLDRIHALVLEADRP